MPARLSFVSAALAILLAGSPAPLAAVPQPAPGLAAADAVRITAVVTDRRGAPVSGLTPDDFDVQVNGIPQAVETVERGPGRRLFAILLDEFHVSPGAAAGVREAVSRFVREELRPSDLVVVLKPLDALTSIEFTADRDAALRAVAAFDGRKGDFTPRTAFETEYIGRDAAAVRAARARIIGSGLRELAARLGRSPDGRGAIVFISDGFVEEARSVRDRLADVETIVGVASRLDVPIYALASAHREADPVDAGRTGAPAIEGAVLRALAERTGGEALIDEGAPGRQTARHGDLFTGLIGVARDLDASYRLLYRPTAPADGTFQAVEVRARREDVRVRVRPGQWAPPAARDRSPMATGTALGIPRAGPPRRSGLITSWLGLARGPEGRARVTVTWVPSRRHSSSGQGPEPAMVMVHAATAEGEPLFEGRIAAVGAVRAEAAAPSAIFEAPPGRVELELAIFAADGRKLDSEVRVLDVGEIGSGGPVILPPAIVRTRTAREFRAASVDPDAPPSPAREFFRIERLLIRAPAYDAGGAALPVRATLLNPLGQPMREIAPMAMTARSGIAQFDLPLGPLWPGPYAVELATAGAAGEARTRIWFRVIR